MFPATENNLSHGTEVAITLQYCIAIEYKFGEVFFESSQYSRGFVYRDTTGDPK